MADAFVLLSGLSAGVHPQPAIPPSLKSDILRALRRCATLYAAYAITCVAIFLIHRLMLPSGTDRFVGLMEGTRRDSDFSVLIDVLLLRRRHTFFVALPFFIALVPIVTVLQRLMSSSPILACLLSLSLYLGCDVLSAPRAPGEEGEPIGTGNVGSVFYLNPLAWQILYVVGLLLGRLWTNGKWKPRHSRFPGYVLSNAVLVVGLFSSAPYHVAFSKESLGILRLLADVAICLVIHGLAAGAAGTHRGVVIRVITDCGRWSLASYCLGAVCSVLGDYGLNILGRGPMGSILVTTVACCVMVLSVQCWIKISAGMVALNAVNPFRGT